jgi:uncharacterized protein
VDDRDPNVVYSGLGGVITEEGVTVELSIHRLEGQPGWAMEVVNQEGTSTVWNELFETDDAALVEFRRTVDEEGMKEFLDAGNVVPFKR